MSRRWRALVVSAGCLVAVMTCGGCAASTNSGGDAPLEAPSTSSSLGESSEADDDKVVAHRAEGARDFVRRWIKVSNAMQNSGEVDDYLHISKGCKPCRAVALEVKGMFDDGGFVKTQGMQILRIEASDVIGDGPVLDVKVNSKSTVLRRRAGAPLERLPGGTVVYRFRLSSDPPWQMILLTQVPS